MPRFVITYLSNGNMPSSPEEGKAHQAQWAKWLSELGSAVIEPQNPFKTTVTIGEDGTIHDGSTRQGLMGYSVIEAKDLNAACDMAKSCPFVTLGMGTLEVCELMQMG